MTAITFERLTAVPSSPSPHSLYFVSEGDHHFSIYATGNSASTIRRVHTGADIDAKITAALSNLSALQVVATIAARNALTITTNTLVLVTDASTDATVTSGAAMYVGIRSGSTTTWTKVSEFESMDVTLQWANVQGKPTSSPANIDDAVSKKHAHANLTQLGKIGQNGDGNLTYDGDLPRIGWDTSAW